MQPIRSLHASALALIAGLALGATSAAQGNFPGARSEVYKTVDDVGLRMHVLLSPYHHVDEAALPTLILHGEADTAVPYKSVVWYGR